MNFAGWVQFRRGAIEHLIDGRLTSMEYFAFLQLVLLANGATGGWSINSPTLCYWCGQAFNPDTAQRILNALHEKRYIWYHASRLKQAQPYWVNKYRLTQGRFRSRITNLSQLYEKEAICDEDVWKLADHPTDDPTDHGADDPTDHGADDNKKEKEKEKKNKKTLVANRKSDSENTSLSATQECNTECNNVTGVSASLNASLSASRIPYGSSDTLYETPLGKATISPKDAGVLWDGSSGSFRDSATGRELSYELAVKRLNVIGQKGLTQ